MAGTTEKHKKSTLLIVESPAKAKTIEHYLGKGYSVEASVGHLIDLPKSRLAIDVDNNFDERLNDLDSKLSQEEETLLKEIKIDDKLSLIREDNKYDSNAIVIKTKENKKLGYVPEKDNIVFARLMDAGKMMIAKIKQIEKKGTFTQITIGIYLVDF